MYLEARLYYFRPYFHLPVYFRERFNAEEILVVKQNYLSYKIQKIYSL